MNFFQNFKENVGTSIQKAATKMMVYENEDKLKNGKSKDSSSEEEDDDYYEDLDEDEDQQE